MGNFIVSAQEISKKFHIDKIYKYDNSNLFYFDVYPDEYFKDKYSLKKHSVDTVLYSEVAKDSFSVETRLKINTDSVMKYYDIKRHNVIRVVNNALQVIDTLQRVGFEVYIYESSLRGDRQALRAVYDSKKAINDYNPACNPVFADSTVFIVNPQKISKEFHIDKICQSDNSKLFYIDFCPEETFFDPFSLHKLSVDTVSFKMSEDSLHIEYRLKINTDSVMKYYNIERFNKIRVISNALQVIDTLQRVGFELDCYENVWGGFRQTLRAVYDSEKDINDCIVICNSVFTDSTKITFNEFMSDTTMLESIIKKNDFQVDSILGFGYFIHKKNTVYYFSFINNKVETNFVYTLVNGIPVDVVKKSTFMREEFDYNLLSMAVIIDNVAYFLTRSYLLSSTWPDEDYGITHLHSVDLNSLSLP